MPTIEMLLAILTVPEWQARQACTTDLHTHMIRMHARIELSIRQLETMWEKDKSLFFFFFPHNFFRVF